MRVQRLLAALEKVPRLKLHFDAEGSLESRVRDAIYEVHIRMPYRSTKAAAQAKGTATLDERGKAGRDAVAPGTQARPEGPALANGNPGTPHG